jgi:hypothetical protein
MSRKAAHRTYPHREHRTDSNDHVRRTTVTRRLTRIYVSTQIISHAAARSLAHRRPTHGGKDDGMTTLEWVVITLGVLLVATIAVAGITAAVNSRLSQIR